MDSNEMLLHVVCSCGDPGCKRTVTVLEGNPREVLYHGNGFDEAAELAAVLVERYAEDENAFINMPGSGCNVLITTFNEATALLFLGATELPQGEF